LSALLQQAREEERVAIGREIHDELGQLLASVQLGVSMLAQEYSDHRHLTEKITEMENLIVSAMQAVERISAHLRPAILDTAGLAEAIEWQAREFRKRTGIDCRHNISAPDKNPCTKISTALFRVCQEALTNVMRHSGATRVDISLREKNDRLVLIVKDNGRGISEKNLRDYRSFGLIGMRERAFMLGGRVRVFRSKPQGTTVVMRIPAHPPGEVA